jgi:outer membrane lipoprotein-sorting protein
MNGRQGLRRVVAAALLGFGLVSAAPAAAVAALALGAEEQAQVNAVQAYLDGVRSVQARFSQVSSNGQVAAGTIYLSRPGKLRVDYDPPSPIEVVATGNFLIYHDRDLNQVSHIPLGATPAGILLDQRIGLDNPAVTMTGFTQDKETLRLSLVRSDSPGEGELTLILRREPMQLTEWEVTDAQGITTRVTLLEPRFGVALDPKLFDFRDPRWPGERAFPSGR